MGRYIGVDLHRNSFVVCTLSGEEKEFKSWRLKEIIKFAESLKGEDEVAVETTTNTRYFVKKIEKQVKKVRVVNTHQFKVISQSVKKTDKRDAEILAEYLSKGLIPEVRMKDQKSKEIESLAQTRDKLVKLKTVLKNKVHNLLRSYGIETKKEFLSSKKCMKQVLEYDLSSVANIELKVIVEQIESLEKSIEEIDKSLIEKGKDLDGFENLTSIKGIGERSATILLSVIGNINDFANRKQLDSYFGIVPKVYDSNDSSRRGRITKRGSKLGRTILVQCTLIAIRYSEYLRNYYTRLKSKKGSGKAIIATARKLLGIIYETLKNNWVFEDFSNFVLKTC